MKSALPYYRKVLTQELARRIERNPSYSLRSFARALNIEAGAFSKILSGKRFLSEKLAKRIFSTLDFNEREALLFLNSIATEKKRSGSKRMSATLKNALAYSGAHAAIRELRLDSFQDISDWYHYAILELTHVDGFQPDPKWMASRLGITQIQSRTAWLKLVELRLVEEKDGVWKKAEHWVDTSDKNKTTVAHKTRQKQILEKSITALENQPIELRNHSSLTMPIDIDKIPEAKKRIQKFMWELGNFLSEGRKENIYELTVNLFSVENFKQGVRK